MNCIHQITGVPGEHEWVDEVNYTTYDRQFCSRCGIYRKKLRPMIDYRKLNGFYQLKRHDGTTFLAMVEDGTYRAMFEIGQGTAWNDICEAIRIEDLLR